MPKAPQRAEKPAKASKPKKATRRPDASQTALLSIVESIIGGKLIDKPKRAGEKGS